MKVLPRSLETRYFVAEYVPSHMKPIWSKGRYFTVATLNLSPGLRQVSENMPLKEATQATKALNDAEDLFGS